MRYAAYIGEVERAAKRNMVDSDYLEAVFSFKIKSFISVIIKELPLWTYTCTREVNFDFCKT